MDDLKNDNAIYEEVDPADITVMKNESYEQVKELTKVNYNKHFEEKFSSKKTVTAMILALSILVLLLVAVVGYTLSEISKLKAEMASSNRAAFQQQNADFTSKLNSITQLINDSIELLQEQMQEEINSKLDDRITPIQTSSNQQYFILDSRINQVQESNQNATQQIAASISEFQQQIKIHLICGGTPGWRRVGYLNMTDPSQSCPSGLALKYYSPGLRSCGRATNDSGGCWSTFYNTGSSQYSRVCGRVRGYQFGASDAFYYRQSRELNSYYVEGVSLTHGHNHSRSHIWTFAAGLTESISGGFDRIKCPCTTSSATQPPAFVGNDYFCESGLHSEWEPDSHGTLFFPNDPLWDGQNCLRSSCCQFNSPPYFIKNLPAPTSDNIELRICIDGCAMYGDTPIDQLELYVQ